jgi:hypothetical protein
VKTNGPLDGAIFLFDGMFHDPAGCIPPFRRERRYHAWDDAAATVRNSASDYYRGLDGMADGIDASGRCTGGHGMNGEFAGHGAHGAEFTGGRHGNDSYVKAASDEREKLLTT